jgi:hypothetical protein
MTATPFNHRRIFDAMMRLPVEYRRKQRLADEVIRASWPELGILPYQTMPPWLKLADRVASRIVPGKVPPPRTSRP